MQNVLPLMFDIILIGMLGVTISYCLRLSRQLRVVRESKQEMASLIRQFTEATEDARESVEELKVSSKRVVENLQAKVEKAGFLADDLSFLIDKASKIADSVERTVATPLRRSQAQEEKPPSPEEKTPFPGRSASIAPSEEKPKSRSQAEKELLKAIKGAR